MKPLRIGTIFSSNDLLQRFGGNIRPSMPIINGVVPYCKFDPKVNPSFLVDPREAWIEVGPGRKKGAEMLINSGEKIPVFEKVTTGCWRYLGNAKIQDVTTSQKLNLINRNPPRDPVQKILKFVFWG